MGRHSAPDDEVSGDEVAGDEARAERAAPAAPRPHGGTHADLQMLRENPGVRARCIAAAVVPFVLYTIVLVTLGRADLYLVWVWIPIVLAGILVGTILDLGFRAARDGQRSH